MGIDRVYHELYEKHAATELGKKIEKLPFSHKGNYTEKQWKIRCTRFPKIIQKGSIEDLKIFLAYMVYRLELLKNAGAPQVLLDRNIGTQNLIKNSLSGRG